MKNVTSIGAQGDLLFKVGGSLPDGVTVVPVVGGRHVAGHSETGHHHTIDGRDGVLYSHPNDPFKLYFVPNSPKPVEVRHDRAAHQHETVRIEADGAVITIYRQFNPATLRAVQD